MVATSNLVLNPSFETVLTDGTGDQWPDQWDMIGTGAGGFTSVTDPAVGGGTWCMDLYKDTTNSTSWHHMQAHTRCAVTAGQQYYGSVQVKAVTTTGYQAGIYVYWFSSATGTQALSSVGSLVAVTTSYQESRLAVTAPAGATYAEVRVYTYNEPANTDSRWDLVIFGPAALVAGNYLSYATQSIETGVSPWLAQTNTTIAVSTTAYAGTQSMRLTATALGDTSALTSQNVTVVAGRLYKAYAQFRSGSGTPSGKVEIQWYDSGNNYLSSANSASTATTSTGWTQITASGASAPSNASYIKLKVYGLALAAAGTMLVDQIVLAEDPILPGNLLTAGEQGIETAGNDTLWVSQANATLSRTTSSPIAGVASLLDTAPAAAASRFAMVRKQTVTAGSWYTFGLTYVMPTAAAYQLRLGMDCYNASSAYLTTVWGPQSATVATGTAATVSQPLKAPTGTASVSPVVEAVTLSTSQAIRYDQMTLTTASTPWTTAVDNIQGAVTLTFNSPQPGGYYTTVTIYRTDPGGTQVPLRYQGGETTGYMIGTGTLWAGVDYEAPRGVTVTYTARWSGPGVGDYVATTDALTVASPTNGQIHLKHPGKPGLNSLFSVAVGPDTTDPARQQIYAVRGRRNPVINTDTRSSSQGSLILLINSDADRAALKGLAADGGILLLQPPPGYGFDGQMYAAIGDVAVARISGSPGYEPTRQATLPLTEVDRPVGGLAGSATRTWNSILADPLTPTWQQVLYRYDTWYDVLIGNEQ